MHNYKFFRTSKQKFYSVISAYIGMYHNLSTSMQTMHEQNQKNYMFYHSLLNFMSLLLENRAHAVMSRQDICKNYAKDVCDSNESVCNKQLT